MSDPRIIKVDLDEATILRRNADIEQERRVAIFDLIEDNFFKPLRICDSYYQAIRKASAAEIETIDMARRGVHNEAAELLMERLEGKVEVDFATARRLFTLICVLHIKS